MISCLLVEDNKDLAHSVIDQLECAQVSCDYAADAELAAQLIQQNQYGSIILDINLGRKSGIELCQQLRQEGNDTPIIMLTARDTLDNKLEGFDAGADDYMIKPFDMAELIARIRAQSHRRSSQTSRLQAGPISANLQHQTAHFNQQTLKLTKTAFNLLVILLRAYPNAISKSEIQQQLWPDREFDAGKLRVHLYNLRKTLKSVDPQEFISNEPPASLKITAS